MALSETIYGDGDSEPVLVSSVQGKTSDSDKIVIGNPLLVILTGNFGGASLTPKISKTRNGTYAPIQNSSGADAAVTKAQPAIYEVDNCWFKFTASSSSTATAVTIEY